MVTKAKKALLASLAAFLCVMLTVFGLSMSVSLSETAKAADETSTVAQVGTTTYGTLNGAIGAAAEGDTVTLLADTTEDVVVNKNITLDLGGKTLTGTNSGKATLTIAKGATATVKNGSVIGTSSFYNIQNNGTATFETLTATAGNTGSSMIDNWGTLTITSGTYTGGLNTVKSEEGTTLTITGGKFVSDYAPAYNVTGTILVYGTTTISGGEFIQNSTSTAARVVVTGLVEGYTSITNVTGGSFTTKSSGNIFHGLGDATSDNFEVSGGTFNKPISEGYCAEGFIPSTKKNADGMYGVKEGKYVAKVGSKNYETLADAIRLAAKGKTVTLLDNIDGNFEISDIKKITLDLNGYTINGGKGTAKAAITNYGTLTITDSSAAKTGTIKRDDSGIEGETSYYVIENHGTMTIEKAIVINNSGYKKQNPSGSMVGSSLILNGGVDNISKLTIKGGEFTQMNFIAIKNDANGELHVEGGTITSNHSAVQNWFNATITGGKITGQIWTDAYIAGESVGNTVLDGDVQFTGEIVMDVYGSIKPELTINGGNLSVTNWRITTACAESGGKPAVKGGTFKYAVPAEYCADRFIPTQNADGTYGVKACVAKVGSTKYETLAEAIAAAKAGETVKLLADVEQNSEVSINKNITLDLNGKKIYNTKDIWGDNAVSLIAIKDGAEVTVMGDGTIAAKKDDCYTIDIVNGKLTIENGTFVGNISVVQVENGELTINGGTFSLIQKMTDGKGEDRYLINCIDAAFTANDAKVAIYGGSFAGFDPNVSPEKKVDGKVPSFAAPGVGITKNVNGSFTAKANMAAQILDSDGNSVAAYDTLTAAIAAAKDGETVKLLADCSGNGIQIKSGRFADKGLTVDFDGHTYTVGGVLVGSTGTGTNAFQLLQGNKITFQNGTIKGVSKNTKPAEDTPNWHGAPAMVIQNYCDLTLKNMTVSGGDETVYTMSNNNGDVVIEDTTINAGGAKGYSYGPFAFDVCRYDTYPSVSVTVRGNSVINGNVEISGAIGEGQNRQLNVENGTFKGTFNVSGNVPANIAISGGTFTNAVPVEYCADGFIPQDNGDGTFGVKVGTYVAEVNGVKYETLQAAFDAAKTGDIVKLLTDITLTAQVNITKALNGLTLDGNGKTITCATTNDVFASGGSALYFGNATDKLYCTGIKIKDLTMTGKARFAIFLCGGTTTEFTNVNISGEYYIAVNLYGTHGATMTNCTISNSTIGTDEYISGVWSNVASANPLRLVNTTVDVIAINAYTTANTLAPKIFIDKNSSAEVHTFDDGSVSYNKKLCVSTESEGSYTVKEYFNSEWVDTYVAEVKGVKYETLQAAIDAAERNATVTLLANTKENVTITQMYITLDLNGHTINGGTEKGKPAVTVKARVTIKDSSAAQTGTIMREDTAENSGVSSHYVIDVQGDGWLTFEGGNVKNNSGVVGVRGASLVRVGDDSVAKYPGLNIKGGTFTQNNFIVIKIDRGDLFLNGGTLTSANSYAIENWKRATVRGGTVNGTVSSWTYSGGSNSELTISGGTINGDVTSVNYGNATDRKATVSVTGGTINGKLDTRSYDPATGDLTSINDAAKATIGVSGGTFKENPSKYLVEESAITENADGTFGVKKAYLARVGNTSYYTMDEAFKAQTTSGEAIVLLRDYTTGSTFNSGTKHRVVDLNRHTWTYTGTDTNSAAFEINNPNTTLTVKNGTIISSTIVGLIPSAMGGTIKYDNAGLVFDGVTMTSNGSSGIETNGNNTNDSVTLKNSTLNVPNGFGIYFPSSGTLTINNSKITAKTMGVQVCSGELNINAGSAITVTGDSVPKAENDGAIQDGAAISIVNRTGYKGLSDIVITGGTFTAKAGNDAIKAYDWANKVESEFTKADLVAVSGGTFSSEVKKDYLADRFVVNKNTNGTYGVTAGSGFAGANVVVTESLAMKVTIANGTASKYVVVTYKGLDGIDKSVKLDTLTDGYYLFDRIMPQMIDVKFSFELYGENDVMLDRKANYSVVDYLAHIIASDKDSVAFRNVAASLIEYANRAKVVKGLTTTVAPTFVDKAGKTVTLDYNKFVDDNKIPAKDTVKAEDISNGDAQVIYKAKVVFDDAYTLTFYTNDNEKQYTYKLDDKFIVFDENGEYTVNVLAQNITTKYVLTVYDKDSKLVQTVTYGVSTYCIRMQETETPQGELYVASYYYGVAVNQYGTANPNSVQG